MKENNPNYINNKSKDNQNKELAKNILNGTKEQNKCLQQMRSKAMFLKGIMHYYDFIYS